MLSIIIPQVLTIIAFHVTCAASYIKYDNVNEMEQCNRAFPFLNDLVYKQRYIKNNKSVTRAPSWLNEDLTLHRPLSGRLNVIDDEEKAEIWSNLSGLQKERPKKPVAKPKLEDYYDVLSEAFRINPELRNAVIKYLAQRWYESDKQSNKKKIKKKTTTIPPPPMFLPSNNPFNNKFPKTFMQKEFTFKDNMDMTSVKDEEYKINTETSLEFQEMNPTNPEDEGVNDPLDEYRGNQTTRQEIDMLEAEYNAKEQRNKFSYLPKEDDKYLKYIALFQNMFNNMNTSPQLPPQKGLVVQELATTLEPLLSIVTLPLRKPHGRKKGNSTLLLNESKTRKTKINSHKNLNPF